MSEASCATLAPDIVAATAADRGGCPSVRCTRRPDVERYAGRGSPRTCRCAAVRAAADTLHAAAAARRKDWPNRGGFDAFIPADRVARICEAVRRRGAKGVEFFAVRASSPARHLRARDAAVVFTRSCVCRIGRDLRSRSQAGGRVLRLRSTGRVPGAAGTHDDPDRR